MRNDFAEALPLPAGLEREPSVKDVFFRHRWMLILFFLCVSARIAQDFLVHAKGFIAPYYFSYYAVDYHYGFVRRGLGGEFASLLARLPFLPETDAAGGATRAYYVVCAVFLAGMLSVVWFVLVKNPISDRRVVLAMLFITLPAWSAAAFIMGGMDQLGIAALAVYAVALSRMSSTRQVVLASGIYGATLALIMFGHEGVLLECGFGTLFAIAVFLSDRRPAIRFACSLLALLPAVLAMSTIAVFGKRLNANEVSGLCNKIPHRSLSLPEPLNATWRESYYITSFNFLQKGPAENVSLVSGTMFHHAWWLNMALGIGCFALFLRAASYAARVPIIEFIRQVWGVRANAALLSVGIVLWLPLFLVGFDWIRWWFLLAATLLISYTIYCAQIDEVDISNAKNRPELSKAVISGILILYAVIPTVPSIPATSPEGTAEVFLSMLQSAPPACH